MNNLKNVPEKKLQDIVHFILSEPSSIRQTKSGKRLQILSPGRLNVHEGPDFLEIAILLDGMVMVGDAEFHKNASDWIAHSHSSDVRYNSVILHIVLNDDSAKAANGIEVLLLNENEIIEGAENLEKSVIDNADVTSIEELQHYALLRLLRKTSDAQRLINTLGLTIALKTTVGDYIGKYMNRRKRPVYRDESLKLIIEEIENSPVYQFLMTLTAGDSVHIPDMMQTLIKKKMFEEGSHFRRELVLNCVLPIALCLANVEARINLFLWFWSTPALNSYGLLNRQFKGFPQNFLWQQQGMLEYIKEHGKRQNIASEAIKSYGFAEVLSFYRLGNAPFKERDDDL